MADTEEQAAMLRGRLQTLLGLPCGTADFAALLAEAESILAANHSVTLLIEAAGEHRLSYRRPVEESAAAWAGLRRRAEENLARDDKTLLTIRSHHIRLLRLRGESHDLDEVVRLRREELAARAGQFPDGDNLLGIARSDLAVALVDRARTALRCVRPSVDPGADLAEARDLICQEIGRRAALYTAGSSLVQGARLVLSEVLVGLAECGDAPESPGHAGEALTLASHLAGYYWAESSSRSYRVLKSQLIRAEALALLGRPADGARAARLACGISGRVSDNIDRGWPLFVLARIQCPVSGQDALRAAGKALGARERIFPPGSCRILEVRELIRSLS